MTEQPLWQQALEQHGNVLKNHLEFWQRTMKDKSIDGALRLAAQKCISNTQTMINKWEKFDARKGKIWPVGDPRNRLKKRSADEAENEVKEEPKKKSKSKNPQPSNEDPSSLATRPTIPPAKDPSGLFMVDTNPSDVKDLLDEFGSRQDPGSKKKRKRLEDDNGETLQSASTADTARLNGKRKKHENIAEARKQPEDDEVHNKSFEAKVELRLKEKEEQRKQKANKKRKRESENSVEDAIDTGGPPQAQNGKLSHKEQHSRRSEEHKRQKLQEATNTTKTFQPKASQSDGSSVEREQSPEVNGDNQEAAGKKKRKAKA